MYRRFYIWALLIYFNQYTYGQLKLEPDKDSIVFSLSIDTLKFDRTYYLEDIKISSLDTSSHLFKHFVSLLPDKPEYLIILYTEGEINENYSVSPFVRMLKQIRSSIMAKKTNLVKSQFIFPEYLTKSTLKDEKYRIESGLRVQLVGIKE